jgi:hypothetical protein
MSSRSSSAGPDLSGFQCTAAAPTDFVPDPVLPALDYSPFAALALNPTTGINITADNIRRARARAVMHQYEATTIRFPGTTNAFPSIGQVNASHDYLLNRSRNIRSASWCWRGRHRNVFFPEYLIGDPRVFQPVAATPTATPRSGASATAGTSRPARPDSPSHKCVSHPDGCRCYTCIMGRNVNGDSAPSGPHPFRCQCP